MGKKKGRGRGRGRPKESECAPGERREEPSCIETVSDSSVNAPSKTNQDRLAQFQDADCEYQHLTGKSDLPQHCPSTSKNITEPKRPSDDCTASENRNYNGVTALEMNSSLKKFLDADVSGKETISSKVTTYSLNGFHQTFPNMPDVNSQCSSSASTARIGESLKTRKVDVVRRPNFGTVGRQIAIVSNYFLLTGRGNSVYHYDVEINDKSAKKSNVMTLKEEKASGSTQVEIQQKRNVGKQRRREVINEFILQKKLNEFYPFYDGCKNLYTFTPLKVGAGRSVDIRICDENRRTKTYVLTVKPANKNCSENVISLESLNEVCVGNSKEVPLEAVMAFDLILCHRDSLFRELAVGRSFFPVTEHRKNPIDEEFEIWKGYNSTLQLTHKGPAVLINTASKAFHRGSFVIEHACNVLGFDITERNLNVENIQKLTKNLRGMKVEVTHLPYPRKYTVESVTLRNAKNLTVDIGGRDMSVSQFFAQKYKRLRFPDLPCLSMKTTGKPTYTPMELCLILPCQPKLGKLNAKQTADMINTTAIVPKERFHNIVNYAKEISQITETRMRCAGYTMKLTPLQLTARVIPAPALAYSNEPTVCPNSRGVWHIDGRNFSESSRNADWILISFADSRFCSLEVLKKLSFALTEASKKVGLNLRPPLKIEVASKSKTYDVLSDAKKSRAIFVVFVLSRRDSYHSYEEVKFLADIEFGLVTQCMEDTVVVKRCEGQGAGQILNNVLSKLNAKLGGINHTFSQQLPICMNRTIVMGADAAHSPRGSRCPSIAAVVGSIDDVPFQYAVSCRVQKNPKESKLSQEIILDMKEIIKQILNSYKNKNRYFPEKIIFFRDGVSQGQFETVLEKELPFIQKACHELFKKIIPVTFIIVQKRHQTRFMPKNPNDGVGRCGNVPPGTTVDTDVTHPVYFDYYLCSHEGIKGTSKPARYVVLHDDNGFRADELQKFSYDLCHVYGRCNRSISIPAPAMNAHLAAARAKKYIDWHLSKDTGSSSSGYDSEGPSLPQEVIDYVNNVSTIKTAMFYI